MLYVSSVSTLTPSITHTHPLSVFRSSLAYVVALSWECLYSLAHQNWWTRQRVITAARHLACVVSAHCASMPTLSLSPLLTLSMHQSGEWVALVSLCECACIQSSLLFLNHCLTLFPPLILTHLQAHLLSCLSTQTLSRL